MNNSWNTPKSGVTRQIAEEQGINVVDLPLVLTMEQALNKYLEAIKADYQKWSPCDLRLDTVEARMTREFNEGLHVVETQLYYRVHSKNSVHSFIVKQDGPQFKRGDILKAASWRAPAKNQARGNIFGTYRVQWTGAEYLR